jgi:hypothetical protein
MKHCGSALLSVFLVAALLAEDRFWRDENGNLAPNTEARSAVNGFGGWLVVTSDADWRSKWETPSNTVPHFTEAKAVPRGKHIFILTFFANPKLTEKGIADVACDIDVIRPDGTSSVHQADAVCFRGELKGTPTNVYLSAPILDFIGEENDPGGKWLVHVTLKDNNRRISLPLKTSFILIDKTV